MTHPDHPPLAAYLIGGAIFLVVFALRMRRMMQHRPFNLQFVWVLPVLFLAMTALVLSMQPPMGVEWAWIAGAFAFGAALGWARAKTVTLTLDPEGRGVMAQGTPLAMVFIIVLFAVRFALRGLLQTESTAIGLRVAAIDSAFLAMAAGLFVARAVEMGLRGRRILLAAPPRAV